MSNEFLNIARVSALPGTLDASTMYIVAGAHAGDAELVFTGLTGAIVRQTIKRSDVAQMIADGVNQFTAIMTVADITARDALVNDANHSALVLVADATGDATVNAGAALYFRDASTGLYTKVSEYESLDVVLNWASLADKPTSTVGDIDSAVSQMHSHSNKATLDKFSEVDGQPAYNGNVILAGMAPAEW